MKKLLILNFAIIALLSIAPITTFANVGVSNNTGKIVLDKPLVAGANYEIPSIQVKNTGNEGSDFGVSTEFNQVQTQLKPEASWIVYSPLTFHLEPGESKIVKARLELPTSAQPGDYFSYIEAHSMQKNGTSGTSIAGAASTKFYFSIAKTNAFLTNYYGAITFIHKNSSWSYVALGIIAIGLLYLIIKRIKAILEHINSKNIS